MRSWSCSFRVCGFNSLSQRRFVFVSSPGIGAKYDVALIEFVDVDRPAEVGVDGDGPGEALGQGTTTLRQDLEVPGEKATRHECAPRVGCRAIEQYIDGGPLLVPEIKLRERPQKDRRARPDSIESNFLKSEQRVLVR